MKKIFLISLFFLFFLFLYGKCDVHAQGMMPGPGTAHITSTGAVFVQQQALAASTPGTNLTFSTPVASGDSVFAVVTIDDSATVLLCHFTNGGSEALTKAIGTTVAGVRTEIWYETNVLTGGTTINCSFGGFPNSYVNISEFSGLKAAGPESTNSATGTSNSPATGNATPTSARNLIIAAGGWGANDYSTGPTNSFTRLTSGTSGGIASQDAAYKIQSSATAASTGWGLTASINWDAVIVAFGAN